MLALGLLPSFDVKKIYILKSLEYVLKNERVMSGDGHSMRYRMKECYVRGT